MADADNGGQEEMQHDFDQMEEAMNGVGRLSLELATNLGRMRNVPAFDGGARILAELRAMRCEMADMQRTMMTRLEAADYNAVARLTNSSLAISTNAQLIALRTPRNEDVDNFPMTQDDIDRASSQELNRLLEGYELPTQGTVVVRRRKLKKYIGIVDIGD
ncbi:hypothetical protein K440DRAFT_665255 [Wilcoxina mikolae CBS 423.85]|nr:hypothetical protein K440DRAFT_665255 [Wilcoxina mikolae CBS 423.85]